MADTRIEWTDAVWNPTTGCDRVSPGCDNCYALTLAKRLKGMGSAKYQRDGDPRTSGPGFGLTVHPDALTLPLRWRKPRRIFVNSMSDLFHDLVPDEYIARVWQVMATTPQHTYQILTKRHARMRTWVNRCTVSPGGWITHDGTDPRGACDSTGVIVGYPKPTTQREFRGPRGGKPRSQPQPVAYGWPLPNVWLGVSVENQRWADIRIPALLDTPAAVRWISAEPLIGPINLHAKDTRTFGPRWLPAMAYGVNVPDQRAGDGSPIGDLYKDMYGPNLDWVVTGGESGPGSRPMHPDWARSLRDQCVDAGVPFFFKQWGDWCHSDQMPEDTWSWLDSAINLGQEPHPEPHRVGKKRAGRLLDGVTWDQYPGGTHG